MPASIGVNLRVTGHCRQGGRKYMEDFFSVAYQQTEDERDLEYAFFGIYDGHGGSEAAAYAKEHLMELIVRQKNFWSDNDDDVLKAIKEGYIATHYAMWREQAKWPKTASGLPSTAGTTASIAFIRRGKIYIGHVGDSGIILGYQESENSDWLARPLTKDHKPESALEIQRIEQCGGKVVSKSGVPRVVWNRPRLGHQGPIRRSTPIDEIPFLAVARSLGDLWSYNSQLDEFVVSPDPDCSVIPIDTNSFRCLIFGTDGLYNMLSPQMAVHIVQQAEKHNENAALSDDPNKIWVNPSKCLVEKALERWSNTKMRADNTSVITLLLDPPGPPRAQVLQNRKRKAYPDSGLEIVTRYEGDLPVAPKRTCTENSQERRIDKNIQVDLHEKDSDILPASAMLRQLSCEHAVKNSAILQIMQNKHSSICEVGTSTDDLDKSFIPITRESTSFDPRGVNNSFISEQPIEHEKSCTSNKESSRNDENVQINEISSSSNDDDQTEKEQMISNTKGRNKKHVQQTDRPVLRSRNAKSIVEQRNIFVRNTRSTSSKQKETSSTTEVTINVDKSKQLRIRHSAVQKPDSSSKQTKKLNIQTKHDQNQNVSFKKATVAIKTPSASNGSKIEWMSAAVFRNIIKQKNALNAKLSNQKSRNLLKARGRLKESLQLEFKQTRQQEKIEENLRRSLRHADQENEKKIKKGEIVAKRGRGRPPSSKNKLKCQLVRRPEKMSLDRLRTRLGR